MEEKPVISGAVQNVFKNGRMPTREEYTKIWIEMINSFCSEAALEMEIPAVGTNSLATGAMWKAGADHTVTGENAVIVGVSDLSAGRLIQSAEEEIIKTLA